MCSRFNVEDNVYCTLFDSNYLDKGLVMIRSLRRHTKSSVYVLAMDDRCADILQKENINSLYVIRLDDFLDEELKQCREQRSRGEFCWSCTSSLIIYIFKQYREKMCTYIDADLYFYSSPDDLISELINSGKSIQIISHNFKKSLDSYLQEKLSGTFCVQFNTFLNDSYSLEIIKEWREQTLADCSIEEKENFGDQKYLDEWPEKYKDNVHILEHKGAGVAPWNFERYSAINSKSAEICFDRRYKVPFVFYHFHNVINLDKNCVNIHLYDRTLFLDIKLIKQIYIPYLYRVKAAKEYLNEKYGFYPLITEHPVMKNGIRNPLIKLQKIDALHHIITLYIRTKRKFVRAIARNRNLITLK